MKRVYLLIAFVCASSFAIGQQSVEGQKKNAPAPSIRIEGFYASLASALAEPEKVISLDLKNQGLTEIPKEILRFPNLERLDVAHNNITELPDFIGQLDQLKGLYLGSNQLSQLPDAIGNCSTLEELHVTNNPLRSISPTIVRLRSLRLLFISSTVAEAQFQPAIWGMQGLRNVRFMNLNITEVPSSVSEMKQLTELCLNDNSITEIPEFLFSMPSIDYLSFGNNKLTAVPSSISLLKNLSYLGLFGNPLTELPASIGDIPSLQFLAVWNTKMDRGQEISVRKFLRSSTQVNFDGTDIH